MSLKDFYHIQNYEDCSINCLVYSNGSQRSATVFPSSILIFSHINGVLKRQFIKLPKNQIHSYTYGEPQQNIFPLFRNEPASFSQVSFSPCFFSTSSGPYQLLCVSTGNNHTDIFAPPLNNFITSSNEWDHIYSLSDSLYKRIMDPEFNPVDTENDYSKWRYFHFLPNSHFTPEPLSVSNTEFIKRDEWMKVNTHCWSPIITPVDQQQQQQQQEADGASLEPHTFLALGSRSTLTLYKVLVPSQSQYPVRVSIGYCNHHHLGWISCLKWLPNDTDKPMDHSLLAVGFGNGCVSIYKVLAKGEIELYRSVIGEPDSRPVTFLEFSPVNKSNQDYILFIAKGMGFYLYSLEKKILSTFLVKNREKITSVHFTSYSQFMISSLDFSILSFQINSNFTSFDQLTGHQLLNIWKEDGKSLGILSVRTSPNNLFLFYNENLPGSHSSMFAMRHGHSTLKILSYNKTFTEFKDSFIKAYTSTANSREKQFITLWDYYLYLNTLSMDNLFTLYHGIDTQQNLLSNWKLQFKNLVYYHALARFPQDVPQVITDSIQTNIHALQIHHYKSSCVNFIKMANIKELQNNQKLSLVLMGNILVNNSEASVAKQVFEKITKLFNGDTPAREQCPICFNEWIVDPVDEKSEGKNAISRFSDCPHCTSPLERCSRSCLFLDTNNIFNCNTCQSKSLIFHTEDIPQMDYIDLPWITKTLDNEVNSPNCIYCSTNLSTKEIFNETVLGPSQMKQSPLTVEQAEQKE
ncbi:hypothetical protein CYY_003318 [Polysphondylium violaceum]|uniref:Transcription factor IIIC 90kDa subunit N-terminal domain-containing protein n=1 Tax=Polysphondylium violaceum TaxID=133409 RepID=A0A8J4PYP7_9MYCE|nr:hypothetical protein CYY_003318 [Polysphondylium violaceum]